MLSCKKRGEKRVIKTLRNKNFPVMDQGRKDMFVFTDDVLYTIQYTVYTIYAFLSRTSTVELINRAQL